MMNKQVLYALGSILLLTISIPHASAQLMKEKVEFTRADSLRGNLTPLRTCYDIQYYHLDVKVDIDNKYISGSNLFRFKATQDFNRLQFDLFANLKVNKVVYKGKELPFKREFNAVFVDFPSKIEKGKIDEFTVYYEGHPQVAARAPWDGGFDWKTDSKGKPWVATACQGMGASVWWPNKDHQYDEVDSMLISVAVPKEVMNVSNGRLVNVEKMKDGYNKYHWKVVNPINNYNVALNIGDYIHFKEDFKGEKGPLTMDYYILRENDQAEKKQHLIKNATETLTAFEHWFGPYPFYEDGYKLVETSHTGMEHQSAVAYGNHYQNGYRGRDASGTGWGQKWDFIVVHESGHEWFGNNITSADLADMWIHESFTNYSEALFIDYFYGKEANQAYVHGNRSGIQNDSPTQGPYHVNKEGSGDMYPKGGVMLNMIRTMIDNDEKWRAILRGLNKDFYHQQVDYQDIVQYIVNKSGIDLTKVFEQYVQHADIPTLEIRTDASGKVYGRWISEVANFQMPIHLGIKGNKKQLISLNKKFTEINIPGLTKENIDIDTFNYYIGVLVE
ncbi:M1 family metallopeptidase [Sphingobacterium sp. SRCM116780]|uniref:M1 family metallopeptidase n=1 Tax=Sphingobacterium sp. SRCM116780 TaxID=2907623 RepID=UPI001F304957|nr:M1 family metallopeptidase [Sphingobacterium sp. SRCM116780]UIR54638.1 M1 family metallopeptidase [Sphingobacterium sp. SRCM116780]